MHETEENFNESLKQFQHENELSKEQLDEYKESCNHNEKHSRCKGESP
jgi:hypothetical protein